MKLPAILSVPSAASRGICAKHTSQARRIIPKMPSELLTPTPPLPPLLLHNPHPTPNLTLHSPHPRTLLLTLFPLNIRPNHKRLTFNPPLHHRLLHPPDSLTRPTATAPLRLRPIIRMPRTARKHLQRLAHAHIRREGRHLGFIVPLVHRSIVVLVFWQLGPEAAENAVASSREEVCRAVFGRWVQGAEDEFRGVHFA